MEVNSPLNTKNVSTPIYPDKIIILRYFVAYWEFEKFHFMKRHSENFILLIFLNLFTSKSAIRFRKGKTM